jgi:hypothetical protein
MDNSRKKTATDPWSINPAVERRRVGRIVHDDRGNARVDWVDAPANYRRQALEIEEDRPGTLSIQQAPRTFNPYERHTLPEPRKTSAPQKDLRKLSEWIKMMRDLEERKRRGEVD